MKGMRWMMMAALTLTAACQRDGGAVVARAADHAFTVAEATRLLAPETQLPGQPEVVLALADLWLDYTLLAEATIADSTLSQLDLDPFIQQQEEAEMIGALRDAVVRPDTVIDEEEVRRRFVLDAPGSRVRARHILLAPPDNATPAERDSVRKVGDDLLRRLKAGENFETLATQFSADPGSAAQGGDLGFFERGQMVAGFDSAAFSLEAGQLSDIVVTPYGFHILRVDEKQAAGFEELGPELRQQMQGERIMRAESLYVTGVEERAKMEVVGGGAALVREIAKNPLAKLGWRASRRGLVKYEGGGLTVDDLRLFMQTRQPAYRQQVEQATDEQITNNILRALSQRELLVAEAKRTGIQPNGARLDSMRAVVRGNFIDAARELGFMAIAPTQGESQETAIDRTVMALLQSIIRGERNVIPMGAISFTLRQQYSAEMFEQGVQQVVEQVEIARGPGAANPPMMPAMPDPGNPGDSGTAPPPSTGG